MSERCTNRFLLARWALVAAAAVAVILRQPSVFLAPRFFAEEGTVYFRYAWQHGFFEALFAPHQGYFSLVPNLATALAARIVPLEYAPRLTGLLALAVNLLPVFLIAFSRSEIWRGPWRRFLGVFVLVLVEVDGGFILNTITNQYHLTVAAFLLLLEAATVSGTRGSSLRRGALLLFCVLSSPGACFLAPVAAWAAWRDRKRDLVLAAVILLVGCGVQALAMTAEDATALPSGARFEKLSPALLPSTLTMNVVDPVVGWVGTGELRRELFDARDSAAASWGFGLLGLLTMAALLVLAARDLSPSLRRLFLGGFVCLAVPTLVFAVGTTERHLQFGTNKRYLFAGTIELLLLFLAAATSTRPEARTWRRLLCFLLLASGLVVGGMRFRDRTRDHHEWSKWPEEVARHDKNPRYILRIWPTGWIMDLGSELSGPPGPIPIIETQRLGKPASPVSETLPTLEVTVDAVRSEFTVTVRSSKPGAKGYLVVGPPLAETTTVRVAPGREAEVFVSVFHQILVRTEFTTDESGLWSSTVPLDEMKAIEGWSFNAQAFLTEPHLAVSNAIGMTVSSP